MNYKELIDHALKEGFSDFEVYEFSTKDLNITVFNGQVEKNELSQLSEVSVRGIYNGKMAYLDIENKDENIDFILNNLKANASCLTTEEEFAIFEGNRSYPQVKPVDVDYSRHSNLERIELLVKLESTIKAKDARVAYVPHCNYQESEIKVHILNSKGLDVTKENAYCALLAQVVAREKDDTQSSFKVQVKNRYQDLNLEKVVDEVVNKTVAMLNAKPVKSKTYPVVIENETMGDLFSAFQSMFSGEAAIKKITPLLGKEKTAIMSDKITIIDDPLKEDAISINPFDDEGVACYTKEVVKNGIFNTFLHNLKTAKYFKTSSTGNGFKTGTTIGVSGSNLYIAPGEVSKDDMVKGIDEGLLITALEGLHAGVNPISGDFSLKAQGFLIDKGTISRAVTLIVVSGNFFKLMKDVEIVGNDLDIDYRGIGAPSIKFKGLSISGE